MSACGCGGDLGNGPVLTGTLDPAFSAPASPANPPDQQNVFDSTTLAASPKARFWEAVAVISFIVVVSWVVYRSEKKE